MAILGKIRERSIFLIFIIGMALLAFVFTGVFDASSSASQDPVIVVGEEEIDIDEFSRQVEFVERNYRMSTMQAVAFAYDQSTNAKAFKQTFDALGLYVGKNHIEQFLKADPNFSNDPQFQGQDGSFDTELFADFILDLRQNNPQGFEQWKAQESSIKDNIRLKQYQDMVNVGLNVTNFEAKQNYELQNNLADLDYVRIPYDIISDSLAQVTSKDIASYIKENADNYERVASRDLRYVMFSEIPTPEDKIVIENELRELLVERRAFNEVSKQEEVFPSLATVSENAIASFINEYSDVQYQDAFLTKSELSSNYANTLFNLPVGEVFGPYEDQGYSKISRLVSRKNGGKAKARHILVAYKGAARASETVTRTKAEAKREASKLLSSVKRGGDFTQLARTNSDGPSASNGGELPEFTSEDMVAPFSNFVFNNRIGALGVVETEFGFHVIEVQDKKDVVKLATVAKKLIPSERTSNQVFTEATQFELDVNQTDFKELATLKGYGLKTINDVKVLDESLPAIGNQRQVVRWAFEEDRKALDVKRFSLSSGGYIIVQIAKLNTAGTPSPEEVEGDVSLKVLKEKKKALLLKQLGNYTTLEDLAKQFDVSVSTSNAVNRFTTMLAGAAKEPGVVGAVFGMRLNDISKPIVGESGVYVVQLKALNKAQELTNYAGYKSSIANTLRLNVETRVADAVKDSYEIIDNRPQYY